MSELVNFLQAHAKRGDCMCGKCIDAAVNNVQPEGHTADLIFFKVAERAKTDPDELRRLIVAHNPAFRSVDLFDGKDHSYMEIGAWIGDQGYALMLMGLGSLLGLWKLLTPRTMFGSEPELESVVQQAAGMGYVFITAKEEV